MREYRFFFLSFSRFQVLVSASAKLRKYLAQGTLTSSNLETDERIPDLDRANDEAREFEVPLASLLPLTHYTFRPTTITTTRSIDRPLGLVDRSLSPLNRLPVLPHISRPTSLRTPPSLYTNHESLKRAYRLPSLSRPTPRSSRNGNPKLLSPSPSSNRSHANRTLVALFRTRFSSSHS